MRRKMNHQVYLLLGSNLGDRTQILEGAKAFLTARCGRVLNASQVYETAAWGKEDQPSFLNQALLLETGLSPEEVLAVCLQSEQAAGRERIERWGARTLDVDILFYDDLELDIPGLHIPHPALPQRRFALLPMADIAPDFVHPILHKSIKQLLDECPDPLAVTPFQQ